MSLLSPGRNIHRPRRSSSIQALLDLFRGAAAHEKPDPMAFGPHPQKAAHVDVARLDACHCGPHGCALAFLSCPCAMSLS